MTLFFEAPEGFNPSDLLFVTFRSLFNATDGTEIYNTMLQDPDLFVKTLQLIFLNWDLDCVDDPMSIFLVVTTSALSDILQEPFRDNFVTIANATFVELAIRSNATRDFISVLEPLSEDLDDAQNVDDSLLSLLSFATQDVITEALSEALEGAGLFSTSQVIAQVLTAFFGRIQESFEIDGVELVAFINDIIKGILDALR
eukprot:TRINITY_DN897_c0_g3_i1.p2 TRINITY_DN897_c0_g3~~TRINITY_DN897_c0_g3_i1.p2  ORF type:complete len:200 (-),score=31.06 TRINITY_DN897_c0_g3_i1:750-1349(-)